MFKSFIVASQKRTTWRWNVPSRASIRLRQSREFVWAGSLPLHEVADHLLAIAARAIGDEGDGKLREAEVF